MRFLPTTFMQKKRHNIWILLMSLALFLLAAVLSLLPVSYTHLDVYKRQLQNRQEERRWEM